jgi:hypothetical protein
MIKMSRGGSGGRDTVPYLPVPVVQYNGIPYFTHECIHGMYIILGRGYFYPSYMMEY